MSHGRIQQVSSPRLEQQIGVKNYPYLFILKLSKFNKLTRTPFGLDYDRTVESK